MGAKGSPSHAGAIEGNKSAAHPSAPLFLCLASDFSAPNHLRSGGRSQPRSEGNLPTAGRDRPAAGGAGAGWSPPGWSPPGWSPPGWSPPPRLLRPPCPAFLGRQRRSLGAGGNAETQPCCKPAPQPCCKSASSQICPAANLPRSPAANLPHRKSALLQTCPAALLQTCPASLLQICLIANLPCCKTCLASLLQTCPACLLQTCPIANLPHHKPAPHPCCKRAPLQICPAANLPHCKPAPSQTCPASLLQTSLLQICPLQTFPTANHLPMSLMQTSLLQNFPTSLLQTFPTAPLLAPLSSLPVSLLPTPCKLSPCPCCQPQCQPCPCCCQRCWETPPSSHFLAEWLLHGTAGDKDPLQQTENMTRVLPSPTRDMEHPHPSREIGKSWLPALGVGASLGLRPRPQLSPCSARAAAIAQSREQSQDGGWDPSFLLPGGCSEHRAAVPKLCPQPAWMAMEGNAPSSSLPTGHRDWGTPWGHGESVSSKG
ncbi:uncharacterized protein LOC115351455 isoform X2 [Aquila chrysaetos chrysaetos]|uniref:uncharacterized protein LOC115351455 isoform X2 n=1 Tax=Aquila chrysaetos chrysaetos TaxID=223781 RepID=UPI001B7D3C0A|nr:uncharacterized protein LOC115351455 isoform X2 [Aquila chrysaetos chrysaetos]